MVYDPNGSDNSSLLSLVQGTISFVAGADRQARRHEGRHAGRDHGHPRHRGAGRDRLRRARPGRRARRRNSRFWSSRTAPPAPTSCSTRRRSRRSRPSTRPGTQIIINGQGDRQFLGRRSTVARCAEAHHRRVLAEVHRPDNPTQVVRRISPIRSFRRPFHWRYCRNGAAPGDDSLGHLVQRDARASPHSSTLAGARSRIFPAAGAGRVRRRRLPSGSASPAVPRSTRRPARSTLPTSTSATFRRVSDHSIRSPIRTRSTKSLRR